MYSPGNVTGDSHSNVGLEGRAGSLNLTPLILQGAVTCCATCLLLIPKSSERTHSHGLSGALSISSLRSVGLD